MGTKSTTKLFEGVLSGQEPAAAAAGRGAARKNLSVVVAGSGEVRDVTISPGTTVGELLETIGLRGYMLSAGPDRPFLASHDDVHQTVVEGAKLYASTPAEAGRDLAKDSVCQVPAEASERRSREG